jgi:hypothetical protein
MRRSRRQHAPRQSAEPGVHGILVISNLGSREARSAFNRSDVRASAGPVSIKGDPSHPTSKGFICVRGQAAIEYFDHPQRLNAPASRRTHDRDVPYERTERLVELAEKERVGVYSVAPYYIDAPRQAGLLLGYAALEEPEIRRGVKLLAESLRTELVGLPP